MSLIYADVVLPPPLNEAYAYFIPEEYQNEIAVGSRVLVRFGKRQLTGFVVEIKNETDDPNRVHELAEQWDSKMNENDIFEWAKNLTDNQKRAVRGALEL